MGAQLKKNNQSAGMLDISIKKETRRTAVASAKIVFSPHAFKIFVEKGSPKGDVLETAKIAGIGAAKLTPQIIPLCHPLELSKVQVSFHVDVRKYSVTATAEVVCLGRTGVEMEALSAASAACLTIYDMMKWADKSLLITEIKLLSKTGGKSGDYARA